jgi:hypothetical protein
MRLAAQVELESVGNHDHRLRPIPVFEHRELHRFSAVHEQSAAKPALILDDPVATSVPADAEQGFRTIRRGRLTLIIHGTSPFELELSRAINVQSGAYEFEREARASS